MADTLIGSVIDRRYRVDCKIGEGGMGAVYRGEHVVVGNKVAIKVLHPEYSQDDEVVRRLAQEARVAGTLGHHNIVQVFDFAAMEDGTHYLVMEFLEGETLSEYLDREGPVPPRFIVPVALQVLEALVAAHARGIVHRDLKPENVFLTRGTDVSGHVKVLDFGISKIRTGGEDLHLTKTGTVLGTPYFMSPEQATGKKDIDARTDIYALGVILYFALAGTYPFKGDTYNELIINIFSCDPPPLRASKPEIPQQVEAMVMKAMAKQREDRFASAVEFAKALQTLIADPEMKDAFGGMTKSGLMRSARRVALSSAPPLPPPPATPMTWTAKARAASAATGTFEDSSGARPASRKGLWAALAAIVALGGGLAFFLATRGPASGEGADGTAAVLRTEAAAARYVAANVPDGGAEAVVPEPEAAASADAAPGAIDAPSAVGEAAGDTSVAVVPDDALEEVRSEIVVIKVSAQPGSASIKINDIDVSNPYEGRFQRGGADVKVEVTARGFEPVVRLVPVTGDQDLPIRLERSRGPAPRRDAGVADAGVVAPPPPPPPPPPPAADAGGQRPSIDPNNPFGRPSRSDGGTSGGQ